MKGEDRWQHWFNSFARDYSHCHLERRRKELQARHDNGPDDFLSGKPAPLPLPRFRVWISDTDEESIRPRRLHRRTNKPPAGRPFHKGDVYLASKVLSIVANESVREAEAILRVTETLGQFDGWDDPKHLGYDARLAARKSARERVYRSLKRYRSYLDPAPGSGGFTNANEGWAIAPEEAGRRAYEVIKAQNGRSGLFSP